MPERYPPYTLNPDLYDNTRMPRSDEVINDLLAPLCDGIHNILEIGAGTGRLTKPLLERGHYVTGLEPNPFMYGKLESLAAVYPNLTPIRTTFEEAELEEGGWDLVVADSAWNCVNKPDRLNKSLALLRAGGAVAILSLREVLTEEGGFFTDPDRSAIYEKFGHPEIRLTGQRQQLPPEYAELDDHPLLSTTVTYYDEMHEYPTTRWIGLLSTHTHTYNMPPNARAEFLQELAKLINGKYGGKIERHTEIALVRATLLSNALQSLV